MNRELGLITKVLPKPKKPIGLERSWKDVEQELGLQLPTDYKQFVDLYGSGLICDSVSIWNLRDKVIFNKPLPDILSGKGSVIAIYEYVRSQGYDWSYKMFPQPGGLLPFAAINDVHNLNWLTVGLPDKWDVVYWFSDGLEFIHLKGDTFSRFLMKVLRKQEAESVLPSFEPPFTFKPLFER